MCTLDIPISVPLETDALLGHLRLSLELAVIYALLHYRFAVSAEEVLVDGRSCNHIVTIVEVCFRDSPITLLPHCRRVSLGRRRRLVHVFILRARLRD